MSSSMETLYQQVILDHAKNPQGSGLVDLDGSHLGSESHQVNPTCGDEVTMRVQFAESADGTTVVERISWEGQGCSISQASLSVLTELVTGKDIATSEHIAATFRELMGSRGKGLDEAREDELGDAAAFTGVSQFPARVKCAMLGWVALRDTFARSGLLTSDDPTAVPATPHHA
ncbi:Fe-S cluster assembly sulfur transfer protein SufU [Sanguibacter antarcticus]|uniref:Nitrogen fixation NifU-like protein n=1 Tax=Sanguibacter antarcticus TaxID=372484 RepID=A0A2A9E2Z0_9MICO|nr:SUF system NifU family Fe-S cluster assembly protein [Sanguibacter antarcticus]PFG33387.1 nitrogen fixation NifU-like protein [Sanguibacter antarcticus]